MNAGSCGEPGSNSPSPNAAIPPAGNPTLLWLAQRSVGGSTAAKKIGIGAFKYYLKEGEFDHADYVAEAFLFLPKERRGYAEAVCREMDSKPATSGLKTGIMERYEL